MQNAKRNLFLAFVTFFMSFSIVSAAAIPSFLSQDWTYTAYGIIYPGALDVVGQIAYFGTNYDFGYGYTNFLYAVNITSGNLIWRYNTTLPVNYVSNFTYDNSTYIIAGTGGSTSLPLQSHVLALYPQKNMTLWNSTNLGSSVQTLGTAGSDVPNTEDVIAGLANGQVIRLSGSNGSVQWSYKCVGNITAGSVPDIVQLDNGSVAVGTNNPITAQGYLYCFKENGSLAWTHPSQVGHPFSLAKRFGNLNDVVAAFTDVINVLNGTTGSEIWPGPFNVTQHIAPFKVSQDITDLLCTEDYTGNRFPDVVAGTDSGFLMIIDGRNATLFRGPTQVSYSLSYIQYMNSYENGTSFLNKTFAVSIENSSGSYYVCGVNASDLTVMKEFSVLGIFAPRNLMYIANSTNFTGDILFSAGDAVYRISGSEFVISEFPSQIMMVVMIVMVGVSLTILRYRRPRTN